VAVPVSSELGNARLQLGAAVHLASDGRVYCAIGDHGNDVGGDARCFIYCWDPKTKKLTQVVDMNKVVHETICEPCDIPNHLASALASTRTHIVGVIVPSLTNGVFDDYLSAIQDALTKRIGTEMLFPVYSNTRGGGANFEYKVIGWIGFVITSFDARGNSGKLYGHFTRVIWEGIEGKSGDPADDLGVRSIELIE